MVLQNQLRRLYYNIYILHNTRCKCYTEISSMQGQEMYKSLPLTNRGTIYLSLQLCSDSLWRLEHLFCQFLQYKAKSTLLSGVSGFQFRSRNRKNGSRICSMIDTDSARQRPCDFDKNIFYISYKKNEINTQILHCGIKYTIGA